MLEIGTKAPGFTLPDQNGEMKSLSDYKGQKVFLFEGYDIWMFEAGLWVCEAVSAVSGEGRCRTWCEQGCGCNP